MTILFGELIDALQFLVNNTLSSSDSNVIRRETMWPTNEETGYRGEVTLASRTHLECGRGKADLSNSRISALDHASYCLPKKSIL